MVVHFFGERAIFITVSFKPLRCSNNSIFIQFDQVNPSIKKLDPNGFLAGNIDTSCVNTFSASAATLC